MALMRAGDVLAHKYEIVELAATGGMSDVYRAQSVEDGTPYAIKVAIPGDAAAVRRFEREVGLLRSLSAPGIVAYIEHGVTDDGRLYLVEEWVGTATLGRRLRDVGVTCAEAVAVALRVCEALAPAHAAGIVHRDLTPGNIALVGNELERVKLLDFGIALGVDQSRLTQTGVAVGTPGYMSPEQVAVEGEIDARSDVFALGCILYECLSGSSAFAGRSLTAVRMKVVLGDPPALSLSCPEAPPALVTLVDSMLAKRALSRPANADAVAERLRRLPSAGAVASPRRPVGRGEQATTVLPLRVAVEAEETTVAVSIAVCASGAGLPPTLEPPRIEYEVREAVGPAAGVRFLPDGTIILLIPGDTPEIAASRGARAAIAAHQALDGWCIALSCCHDGRSLSEVIDWVSESARLSAARAALAPETGERPIWVDDAMVPLIEGEFSVRCEPPGFSLVP